MNNLPCLQFVRILVRGRDRAKFLHNFCTNNIKAMLPGQVLEAFFVNVQAKVLAHGYVAAFEDRHEIWMLPGDPAALVKHLSRYVISEDVQVELAGGSTKAFRWTARGSSDPCPAWLAETGCGSKTFDEFHVVGMTVTWGSELLTVIGGSQEAIAATECQPEFACEPLDTARFEQLRISERYPIIGTDMTNDHLAPEADRNALAISYTKGCYLGQEPIARIDALGHVNKSLKLIVFQQDNAEHFETEGATANGVDCRSLVGSKLRTGRDGTDDRNIVGIITSACRVDATVDSRPGGSIIGLSIIRLSAANQQLHVVDQAGNPWLAHVRS